MRCLEQGGLWTGTRRGLVGMDPQLAGQTSPDAVVRRTFIKPTTDSIFIPPYTLYHKTAPAEL